MTQRLPIDFIEDNPTLTPLLLMRKELKPIPRKKDAANEDKSHITISSSPNYPTMVQKFYNMLAMPPATAGSSKPRVLAELPLPSPLASSDSNFSRESTPLPSRVMLLHRSSTETGNQSDVIELNDSEDEDAKIVFYGVFWIEVCHTSFYCAALY